MVLYNYSGLVAPRLRLYNVWYHLTRCFMCSDCVLCSSSAHRAPGKKVTVPIYKVFVRPGRESKSRLTSTKADALTTTRPRAVPLYKKEQLQISRVASPNFWEAKVFDFRRATVFLLGTPLLKAQNDQMC